MWRAFANRYGRMFLNRFRALLRADPSGAPPDRFDVLGAFPASRPQSINPTLAEYRGSEMLSIMPETSWVKVPTEAGRRRTFLVNSTIPSCFEPPPVRITPAGKVPSRP